MKLNELQTPSLLLDLEKFEANCAWMKAKAARLGVRLRPHLKTGKCREMALRQMTSPEGPATVSTLLGAEKFFAWGVKDIVYAVGISPGKFSRAAALVRAGCDLKVILDSVETARLLSAFCAREGLSMPCLIEIDCDGHRSGVKADSRLLLEVAASLTGGARLVGVLTHAGESYNACGREACRACAERERDEIVRAACRLREAGHEITIVSAGSTPTAVYAEDWTGVTEVRCGVCCLFDLVMAGIGVCTVEQIALSLLVEVIGHQPEKGWVVTDGGWMATSRDRGTAAQRVDQGYGLVCDVSGKPFGDLVVRSANQEHCIVADRNGLPVRPEDFPVGTRLRILPNHACAMAAQHPRYRVVSGGEVVGCWERFYGWD